MSKAATEFGVFARRHGLNPQKYASKEAFGVAVFNVMQNRIEAMDAARKQDVGDLRAIIKTLRDSQ